MESPLRKPVAPDFHLIETFRIEPETGPHDLSRHLRRMERSARAFQIPFDRRGTEAEVQKINAPEALRARLTLDAKGQIQITTTPLGATPSRWTVQIAQERLQSDDVWLQHKTTCRALYDQARASLPQGVDELLFLNERDEVCEGTITNLFVKLHNGPAVTPPLRSGCLPGVLRQRLLDTKRVVERVVTLQDLRHAQWITVGNSLRGEISVDYKGPRGPLI
ncbi:aminotransferase class IV family protein [Tropicibacter sp. Alg240-R139]|uniref:aminotransferase class IV family protein n=1 Tax=Tropicibacter sp. Alg240-R139 TaxID=2305991 RepID=UPI0013DF5012|nr:aminotransferase class IV family protein [Tropicibacter sp. Alg240-R139]